MRPLDKTAKSKISKEPTTIRRTNLGLGMLFSVMMVVYLIPAVRFLFIGQVPSTTLSIDSPPELLFPVFGAFCTINIVCITALFMRKKWGFWGLLAFLVPTVFLKFRIFMSSSSIVIEIVGTLLILVIFHLVNRPDRSQLQ